jgi:hypothetical protein
MGGGRPPIIDDEEEGPLAREGLPVGVQNRARQRKDDQGREQHAERRQPPGTVGRSFLRRLQILEQPRRREDHELWAWRGEPEQPPNRGKRGERGQNPGLEEADRADRHHGCGASAVLPAVACRGGR